MNALTVLVVGVVVVLGVLAMLWAAMSAVGAGFRAAEAVCARRAPPPSPAVEPDLSGVPPEHLAAIAAAVATIIEAPHRIVRIMAPTNTKPSWTLAGRLGSYARGAKV